MEGRIQGHLDSGLSDLGREQAGRLRERLAREDVDAAYSSSAGRAAETARIAVGSRIDFEMCDALCEINMGVWEGIKASVLKERVSNETELWFRKPSLLNIEGAEPLGEFRHRVDDEFERIRAAHDDDTHILVFTHGGVICTYLTSLLGLDLDDLWRFKIRNGSITRLIFPMGGPRIETLNDISHLDGTVR